MSMLSPEELAALMPAESSIYPAPIPVQSVSSDEFAPGPQTQKQKEYEFRVKQLGAELSKHQGLTRRKFFKTAS